MSVPEAATARPTVVERPGRAVKTVVFVVFLDLVGFGIVIPILPIALLVGIASRRDEWNERGVNEKEHRESVAVGSACRKRSGDQSLWMRGASIYVT